MGCSSTRRGCSLFFGCRNFKSLCVQAQGYSSLHLRRRTHITDVFITDGNIGGCNYGMELTNLSGFYAKSISISESTTNGVFINPSAGLFVTGCYFSEVVADTSTVDGWNIFGSGLVAELTLSACWACNSVSGSGIVLRNSHTDSFGNVGSNGILLEDCTVHGNFQHGILVSTGLNTNISNNMIFNNSTSGAGSYDGIAFAANVNAFQVMGNISGRGGFYGATAVCNQGYGIRVNAGTSNDYIISNNRLPGNQPGPGIIDGGTGTSKYVGNNLTTS